MKEFTMTSRTALRLQEFETQLCKPRLDIERLRRLCHAGIPDKPGMRALMWKILLGYLPPRKEDWDSVLEKQRKIYSEFVSDFIMDTHKQTEEEEQLVDPLGASVVIDPLGAMLLGDDDDDDGGKNDDCSNNNNNNSNNDNNSGGRRSGTSTPKRKTSVDSRSSLSSPTGKWDTYFKDNVVIEQIDKDVKRLCPEFAFFQGLTHIPRPEGAARLHHRVERKTLVSESISTSRVGITKVVRKNTGDEDDIPIEEIKSPSDEYHWEVIERILFIYAKLNPGIGYVQGMNEILGPLYYVMASNPDIEWRKHAEADAYWCFMMLLSEFRDNFIKSLDNSDLGIGSLMARLTKIITTHDVALHADLEEKGIKPMFYAFRWLTCLLSQEFPLPDVIRLWDSLFSKTDRQGYLLCTCCALLMCVKDQILSGSFADNVKLLQHLPPLDAREILSKADGVSVKLGYEDDFQAFLKE